MINSDVSLHYKYLSFCGIVVYQGNSLLDTACKTFGKQEMKNLQVKKHLMFVVIKIQLTFLHGTEVVCVSGNVFPFLSPLFMFQKRKKSNKVKNMIAPHYSALKDNTPT